MQTTTPDRFETTEQEHTHLNDDRVIDATVKRSRRKVGANLIQTVRGLGFRLGFA